MANLIEATVYQIDGNPQNTPTVVAFDTNKIRLQATTLSTIIQVASFIEVEGEKLNAPVVKYFVSETVATLVAAANTGGTTLLQANVVAINENPFKVAKQMAFPANKVTVWSFSNGNIQSFLQLNEDRFYATDSKASLVAAANAGGGIEGASNGLSIDGTDVVLGGTLLEQTTIDVTDGRLVLNTNNSDTQYIFADEYCSLYSTNSANDINAGFQLQDDGSITLNGNNNSNILFGSILALNILGTGQSRINNTFSADNDGNEGTVTYDSYLADENGTQLEHITNFFNDGEYFPITARFSIKGNPNGQDQGIYNFLKVPTYASNVTALAGGLVVGDLYRVTGTGNLNIVF
jgi:hypothetical protein